jgi:hypothetical protein
MLYNHGQGARTAFEEIENKALDHQMFKILDSLGGNYWVEQVEAGG